MHGNAGDRFLRSQGIMPRSRRAGEALPLLVSQREMDQCLKSGIDRSIRLVRGFDSGKVCGTVEELDRIELRRTE
jgi:hypothetical protein